ncbi:unnamed protein product [Orchesella dallaii]|uniref:Uncharacterized protein n=1 Tax=Orchesella dallaii TaxID=48710 RepID=A0ABP1Q9I1_9HEXA
MDIPSIFTNNRYDILCNIKPKCKDKASAKPVWLDAGTVVLYRRATTKARERNVVVVKHHVRLKRRNREVIWDDGKAESLAGV